ncbi:MAG: hypothetical protein WC895_02705 [Candidatus Shapirobacteria bacterium]|jgi:hypothetical protein
MKIKILALLFFLVFVNNSFSINAQESNNEFIITATNPANGENNIPTNLKDGNCQNQYCSLIIGLGNSDKSPKGQGYPFLVQDSLNSSTVQVSGPNPPSQIKIMGSSEGGNDPRFYHSNALFLFNSSNNLYYLEPNSTYTFTFKSGINGVKAQYSSNTIAYLASDYSFSFTTGSGPTRTELDFPTSVPTKKATPSQRPIIYSPTPTLIPTLTNKPTNTPTINKKQTNPNNTPSLTSQVLENDLPSPTPVSAIENQTQKNKTFWQRTKLMFSNLINKLFKRSAQTEVVSVTPTPTLVPIPTQLEETPISTSTPTTKVKPKPTVVLKPISTINENILKTKFGINSPDLIILILNDSGKLENYEREYYQQIKGWPEINTTALEQRIFIPSFNSTKICKTANIIEVKNAVINLDNLSAAIKSEMINTAKNRVNPTASPQSLDEQIKNVQKDINVARDTLNALITKYCRNL